jgi:1-phosphatidylinositol-4-phosphate 5-kinase
MRHILPSYYQYIKEHGHNSLIVKIYGMHKIRINLKLQSFIVMKNIFDTKVSERYKVFLSITFL